MTTTDHTMDAEPPSADPAPKIKVEEDVTAAEYKDQANAFFKGGYYQDAVDLYTKAIELDQTQCTFYSNRAAALLEMRKYPLALQDCICALALDQTFTKAHFRAAKCLLYMGKLDDAADQLMIVKKSVNNKHISNQTQAVEKELKLIAAVRTYLAEYEMEKKGKRYTDALKKLESAFIAIDMGLSGTGMASSLSRIDTRKLGKISFQWKTWRCELLVLCGDILEASQSCAALMWENQLDSQTLYLRALIWNLLDSQPADKIVEVLLKSYQMDFENPRPVPLRKKVKVMEVFRQKGNAAFKAGDFTLALTSYQGFLDVDAEYFGITKAKILSNRATVYSKLAKYAESVEDCQASLDILDRICFPCENNSKEEHVDISPQDKSMSTQSALYLKLYLRRADAYTKLEKFEEAVRDYTTALAMNPSDREMKTALSNAKHALEMSKRKDYYKILQVDRSASSSEIKKAYRKLALVHHPDKQAGMDESEREQAEVKFKEISEAYSVLSDEKKKRMFDSGRNVDGASASAGQSSGFEEMFSGGGFGGHGFGGQFGGHDFGGGHGFGQGGGGFHFG